MPDEYKVVTPLGVLLFKNSVVVSAVLKSFSTKSVVFESKDSSFLIKRFVLESSITGLVTVGFAPSAKNCKTPDPVGVGPDSIKKVALELSSTGLWAKIVSVFVTENGVSDIPFKVKETPS